MPDNAELHVVFGTGAVGMSVMDALVQRSPRRVRMVNRSGGASVPEGVEVVKGDAADPTFTREASAGASVVYFALNPPYDKWPELFPPLQAGVLEGAGERRGEAHSDREPLHVRAHRRSSAHRGSPVRS
jgi:uncharacterized protein YbjT (DUF2867 family)